MTGFKRTNFSCSFGSKAPDTLLPALAAILMLVAASQQADAQALLVGSNSSDQTTNFTSGTNTYTIAYIGYTNTDSNNTLNVFNPGTRLTISGGNVQVGFGGNNNRMVISNGGFVSDVTGVVSFGAGSNNSALVTGAGSTWSNSTQVRLAVAGQGSLTVANGGSVIATGVNGIQVAVSNGSVGVLNIGSYGGSDSAGSIVAPKIGFNNGTGYLNFNQTNTFTLTNAVTGVNTILFQQLGSGTTILMSGNSSANSTFISQGTLQIGDGGANGSIGAGAITNNSVLAINSSTNVTFGSGNGITGTGVLVQMGTGTTTLTGSNTTYSGGTLISGGTLQVGNGANGNTAGSLGTGNVTNNGSLVFSRQGVSDTVSSSISGTGVLTILGSFTTLSLAGSNSYSGLTTINSGTTLQIGTGSTNGTLGSGSVSNAGTLKFNRSDLYTVTNAISGSGALSQIGSGTTILSGSNSSSGTTTVTNGMLQIGNGGTSGSVGSGAISLSGAGLLAFNRADSVTLTNSIAGGGGVLMQMGVGTLIVTGLGATYGQTVISNGTLQIGDGGANGSIGVGAITNNAVLAINSSTNITFGSGNGITGTGALIQMGTGITTLNASNTTYSGGTLISGGTLQVGTGDSFDTNGSLGTGNVTNNATLAFKRGTQNDIVSNNISGTGALTVLGSSGRLILAGSNSYSGLTTITTGNSLQIGTGGTNSINGTLGSGSISNAGTLSFNRSDLYTVTNTISGSGVLSQIGSGTTILLGSNSGTTTVTNGILQIGNGGTSGSLGSGGITLSDAGLLAFNRADSVTITNFIGGGGGVLMQMGVGTLVLARRGATYGQTVISNGTLQIGDGGTNGSIGAGAITNNAVLAINSSTNITFGSGNGITGTGVLIQMGTGTTTLVASNTTYSGGTLISGGTLQVGNGAQFDTTGSLGTGDVTNNATLAFNRRFASDTVSNNISGTGALTVSGSSAALTLAGSNSFSGLTTINSGNTLQIGTGSTNGTLGSGSVSNAGTLTFNRSGLYTVANTISGAGALRQIGTGTTTLSGSNTYTGTTSITAGTLLFQNTNALYGGNSSLWTAAQIIVSSNATAAFGVGGASGFTTSNVTTLLGNLTAVNNNGLKAGSFIGFDTTAGDFNLTNNIANSTGAGGGSLGLTKLGLGTLTLSGSNSYGGVTKISGGTLQVTNLANAGTSGAIGTNGTVILIDGGTFDYVGTTNSSMNRGLSLATGDGGLGVSNASVAVTLSGAISDVGNLVKRGAGTLRLSASNSFTGATSVSAGTLELASLTGSAAGSVSSVTVASGATLLVSQSDQVNNSATVTLSGGTIARGSGVSEVFGDLNLTVASFLDFGTGTAGNLTFGIYQNNTTPSALLTINNFGLGNTLVFGSDLTSTINNASYFSFSSGISSTWDDDASTFTITAVPETSTYVAALGLLALGALPLVRRKRAKVS